MAIELGTAYIQIQPSTKGLIPALKKELGDFAPVAEKAGKDGGDKMSKGLGAKVKGGVGKLGGVLKTGLVGAAAAGGLLAGKALMDGISGAADLEQSRGGLSVVFEKETQRMTANAKEAAKTVGMSEDAYNVMATKTGAFLKGVGLDYVKSTEEMMGRAADVSATFGGSAQEAGDAMNAFLRGSYEPMERFGVVANEAMVNQELAARGQDKLTGSALEAAKAQARYDLLLKATSDTQGAFANESDTMAHQQQVMGAQWDNLKAKMGEGFLPVITSVMTFVNDKVIPGVERMSAGWSSNEGPLNTVKGIFSSIGTVFMQEVVPALSNVYDWFQSKVMPVIKDFGERVVEPIFNGVVIPALKGVWSFITEYLGPSIGWLFDKVFAPTFKKIGDVVDYFGDNWASIWNGIQRAAAVPINFVIGTIWNNGLRKVLNLIPGVDVGGNIAPIQVPPASSPRRSSGGGAGRAYAAYARGGILPGFSRAHHGDDQLIMARKGEGIVVSEALDDYEKNRLLSLNDAALRGISPKQFRERFDGHFAKGGIVGFRGHRFTETFVNTLKAAESLAKTTFRISQGGFRPRTSYSGTSHFGDAVDLTPVTTNIIMAMRRAGIAAWDRTGKGNWKPHIHGVPLPGYGRAAGSAVWQAQDYLRGGDGLGGRDNGPRVNASGLVPDGEGGFFDLLTKIPEMWKTTVAGLKELTGPWGGLLKDGMKDALAKAFDFVTSKVPGLDLVMDFFGRLKGDEPERGYATGTRFAARGPAWVGENGPEIVNFRGGEQVYTAEESAAMTAPVHIENINLPGIKTFRELMEFVEELPHARRHGHMIGAS